MQYAGRSFTLHSEEKMEVNEACGNHLLNSFGQRGLTFLKYGDDEEKIGAEAIQRNVVFKRRMIGEYNQRNEQRKMMGLGYLPPTKKLSEYALELGIKLIEPYTMQDTEREAIYKSTQENKQLKKENIEFKKEINELKEMIAQIQMDLMAKKTEAVAEIMEENQDKPEDAKRPPGRPKKEEG